MKNWNQICDNLEIAFEGLNAPYIGQFIRYTRWENGKLANTASFWVDGILEIIAELLNKGYQPKEEFLYKAIAYLEQPI